MKRLLSISIAMVLLASVLVLPASSFAATTGVVQGGWLRLRAQPNFNANTINSYYTGTVVSILETLSGWYRVQTPDGSKGYMYSSYISLSGGGGGTGTSTVWSANGYGVRLRTGPGTGYRVLAVYNVGTTVTVLQKGSYWSYIRIGSRTGYMMNQFLTDSSTPTPTPDANARIWSANGYGVRLRTGPGKGYKIIGVYSVGTSVKVLQRGSAGGWDYILVGSRAGYMMNEFLRYYSAAAVTAVTLNTDTPVQGFEMKAASITPYDATVSYQWMVDSTVVSTNATYVVSATDVDKKIRLTVTGTGAYTGTATAITANAALASGALSAVTLNTLSPVVGDTLQVQSLTPAGAQATYQWSVDGVNKATTPTYTVEAGDFGKQVKLVASGVAPFSGSAEALTNAVAVVGKVTSAGIVNETVPGATGPNVGDTLRATFEPSTATVRYEWYVTDGTTISSAPLGTEATYQVTQEVYDQYPAGTGKILLRVYGTGAYETTPNLPVTAQTGAMVNNPLLGSVILDVTEPKLTAPEYEQVITATVLEKDGATVVAADKVTYTWYADGTVLPGEESQTLTVDETLEGKSLKVKVTAKDGSGYGGDAESLATKPVEKEEDGSSSAPPSGEDLTGEDGGTEGAGDAKKTDGAEGTGDTEGVGDIGGAGDAEGAGDTEGTEGAGDTGGTEGAGDTEGADDIGETGDTGETNGAQGTDDAGEDLLGDAPQPQGWALTLEEPVPFVESDPPAQDPEPSSVPEPVMYEVLLSETNPKVGDELIATLCPELEIATFLQYEWFVGEERMEEISNRYTVQEEDVGQKITVKVWVGDSAEPLTTFVKVRIPVDEE